MTSTGDEEEFDEAAQQYSTDTTWSWVNWFIYCVSMWKDHTHTKKVLLCVSACVLWAHMSLNTNYIKQISILKTQNWFWEEGEEGVEGATKTCK